jgi:hypothetical protein
VNTGNIGNARIASDPTPEEAAKVQAVIDRLPAPQKVLYSEAARQARADATDRKLLFRGVSQGRQQGG